MALNKAFLNVILLGFAFMLIFTAFQTQGNIQKIILASAQEEYDDFTGDGYISLAIIYVTFSVFNWSAPSVISLVGPKFSMFIGAITYVGIILTFLRPYTWTLYGMSAVVGIGAALLWTGQGNYLTLNSSSATISRNSGVFWAMLQASMFFGNLFVFFQFQGKDRIDTETRVIVVTVLSVICAGGSLVILFLPKPRNDDTELVVNENRTALQALKDAGKMFFTKNMLLLCVTFLYTGIELSFFSGVYGTCLGFTRKLGDIATQLVGLHGIFIGVGEVLGGAVFGILGAKTTKCGRDPIVVGGFIVHVIAFFLIFLNLPNSSPMISNDEDAFIATNAYLALFCSFLLGLGDACFNTQVYSILGDVFHFDSASAFAIFKFTQSIGAAAGFFYSSYIGLYIQLGILLAMAVFGTVTFVLVEWSVRRRKVGDADTHISSSASDLTSEMSKN
ncbi:UNC93-like protein MFSD11 isoform X2 [Onthophagus taurus]|uniref:UNC93-like protein MFSD11 isoform X2 n=1 Tax=Onthophagus taurus TaxID=166361 RepID=UPI000C204436|nr:UNC93-like protein MFSD11 [Onthophagus taurus]